MAVVLALPHLYDAVVARFAAEGTSVPNVFGWREPTKRSQTARRIVWVPGDDKTGELGELGAAKFPGRDPRPLATLDELFTVYLSAQDPTAPETERAQYQIARELFDAWWRAVHLAAHGTVVLRKSSWVIERKERRFGATIRALCSIQAMVPDAVADFAPLETGAEIATSELDVTETTKIAAPVRAATTAPASLLGVGGTLDGVVLAAGDRVLVKNQAAGAENGIYVVASGAWSRATDADTSGEVPSGLLVVVQNGAENGGAQFVLTTQDPITLGTTPLTFERVQT